MWWVSANTMNKQWRTVDKGWPSSLGVDEVLKSLHRKKNHVARRSKSKPRTWTDTLVQPKQRKSDRRFGSGMLGACIGQVNLQQQPET